MTAEERPERRLPAWAYPALRVLYWVAVVAVSLVLLVLAILFLETRDPGPVDEGGGSAPTGRERPSD
jgi:hypothetical protein